jgi:hypothetical protein
MSRNKIIFTVTLIVLLSLGLVFINMLSRLAPAGHGSIKSYRYTTTKYKLENAVSDIIKNNSNIFPDTIQNYMIDVTNGKHDTIYNNYYNDGKNYVTFKIKDGELENEYIIRYRGDEEYWKTSTSSEIFICYISDNKGNVKFEKTPSEIRTQMLKIFEEEFVSKIDKELKLTHSVDE